MAVDAISLEVFKNLFIDTKLGIGRHIFSRKQKEGLKVVHWYKMHSDYEGILIPQTEEGIEEVRWIKPHEIELYLKDAWKSLEQFYYDFV